MVVRYKAAEAVIQMEAALSQAYEPKQFDNGRSKADIVLVRDYLDPAVQSRRARSAIVYHDHFKIAKRLAVQRREALIESLVRLERGNNHRHRWVAGPRFSYHFRLQART